MPKWYRAAKSWCAQTRIPPRRGNCSSAHGRRWRKNNWLFKPLKTWCGWILKMHWPAAFSNEKWTNRKRKRRHDQYDSFFYGSSYLAHRHPWRCISRDAATAFARMGGRQAVVARRISRRSDGGARAGKRSRRNCRHPSRSSRGFHGFG